MKLKYILEKGQKINRLTLVENLKEKTKYGSRLGLFRCDCGNDVKTEIKLVCTNEAQSCGCLRIERLLEKILKHGGYKERLYTNWEHIKDRCYNKNSDSYNDYGGRGITVCEEWKNDYAKFREWAKNNGYVEGLTIERKQVNGNYEPNNCEWIPNKDQSRNTRRTKLITAFGETKLAVDWEKDKRCIINKEALKERIKRGWSPEKAMITQLRYKRKKKGN